MKMLALSDDVLRSHSVAFNRIRNAAMHYAGLPEKLTIKFEQAPNVVIKADADPELSLRAMVYFSNVFRSIIELHHAYTLIGDNHPYPTRIRTLKDFFNFGIYNGHRWVESTFEQQILRHDDN